MKINQEYLKKLLEAFESSPEPTLDLRYLEETGLVEDNNMFIFHMQLLDDNGFIEREDKVPGFGFDRCADGCVQWSVLPLRLTARGHEFIEQLRNKEVWATITSNFKDASMATLWSVSKQLLEGFTKKKIEDLTGIKI